MNITRRELLGGAAIAMSEGFACKRRFALSERKTGYRDGEFPIIWLILGEKRNCFGDLEPSYDVNHLVAVDLENEDEWGDINSVCVDGQMRLGLGNDVDGYWMIERAFEIVEPTLELHEEKYPFSFEISLDYLGMMIEDRVNTWIGRSV